MREIKLTKDKFALVDDDDFERLSKYTWHCNGAGYAQSYINKKHVLMHRIILNLGINQWTDHVNNDAVRVYNQNAKKYFGEFAFTNKISI